VGIVDDLKRWYSEHSPQPPVIPQYQSVQPSYGQRYPAGNMVRPQSAQGPAGYALEGEGATVTLNGSGNGTARWSPGQPPSGAASGGIGIGRTSGYTADVTAVAVSVAPAPGNPVIILEAQASLFVSFGIQSATPSDFQGQTVSGSHGDTCTLTGNAPLRPGDWITVTWSGGDAGALATMKIFGTVNPPGIA
jgi:hypothetical protein